MFFVKRQHQCIHHLDQLLLPDLRGLLALPALRDLLTLPARLGLLGLPGFLVLLELQVLLDLLILVAAFPILTLMTNLDRFSMSAFTLGAKDILGLSVYVVLPRLVTSEMLCLG